MLSPALLPSILELAAEKAKARGKAELVKLAVEDVKVEEVKLMRLLQASNRHHHRLLLMLP